MLNIIYPIIGSQSVLPFYLTGIGISEPEYNVERENGLISHQFLYTRAGSGVLEVNSNSYIQKSGSVFYLSPGVAHKYYPKNNDWTTCWFVFRGSYADKLMGELGFGDFEVLSDCDISQLETIFMRIMAAAENPLGSEKCSALIYKYILCARELFFSSKKKYGEGSIVETAVKYIDESYMNDIQLSQLAQMSGVSLQHFCRVFKAKIGMRPMEYIAKKRIAQAKLLLLNTPLMVAEVGAAVGYNDQNYFGIVFKKYEGISPSDYRRFKGSVII